jgi:Raf kinase inhibitor-like YbhB/YbcL family protein
MELLCPAFNNYDIIPDKFTCFGANVSPELHFVDVPIGTKSLALTLEDPDAPTKVFAHWLIWNLNPVKDILPEDRVPEKSMEGINDFGAKGYGGPCPPSGTHRYYFRLFALRDELRLDPNTKVDQLKESIKDLIIEEAELIGLCAKKLTQ